MGTGECIVGQPCDGLLSHPGGNRNIPTCFILDLQPRDKATMLEVNTIEILLEKFTQRREMLLFLTTNMAAVTSRGNQQYHRNQVK